MISIIRNNYDTLFLLGAMLCLCFFTCRGTSEQYVYQYAAISPPSAAYCEFDSLMVVSSARQDSINRQFDIALAQAKKDRVPVIYQSHQAPRDTLNTRIKITRVSPRFGEEQRK